RGPIVPVQSLEITSHLLKWTEAKAFLSGQQTANGGRNDQFNLIRSYASQADMSERITWSPTFRPSKISMKLTELRPSLTCTRTALLRSSTTLKRLTVVFS